MGIDIYLDWAGFNKEDRDKQLKGFDATIGETGYLREAYHGGPYVTQYLVQEAFDEDDKSKWVSTDENSDDYRKVRIPNKVLVERLPKAIEMEYERCTKVYKMKKKDAEPYVKSFIDFVKLHGMMEAEGRDPKIYASF